MLVLTSSNAIKTNNAQVQQVMKENDGELELGNTANYINLPISIIHGKFSMTLFEQPLCAFALFHGNKKKSMMPYITSPDEHQQISNVSVSILNQMVSIFYASSISFLLYLITVN